MKNINPPAWLLAMSCCIGMSTEAAQPETLAPVSLEDTLAFRAIDSVSMAPGGRVIAYISHVADLSSNTNPHSLRVVNVSDRTERELLNADVIADVQWSADSRKLYALAVRDGKYTFVSADVVTGKSTEIGSTADKVNNFACAPSGDTCVYTTARKADPETARRRKEEGVVYEWGRHTQIDIVERNYSVGSWEDFYRVDVPGRANQLIYSLKYDGPGRSLPFIFEMKFAPDGRKLALSLWRKGTPEKGGAAFDADVAVLDLDAAQFTEAEPHSILSEHAVAWSADSRKLLFAQGSGFRLYDVQRRKSDALAWATLPGSLSFSSELIYDSISGVAYAWAKGTLYKLDFGRKRTRALNEISASPQMSFDRSFTSYAFVDEASERKPEVAVSESGAVRRLTDLNPWLENRARGRVESLRIQNAGGVSVDAYLVYPTNFIAGHRYPLVIATYGFTGAFVLTAEWHTTFPAQALAGQGYAVLLLNHPPEGQSIAGNPVKARDREGWQMLSTFENAVDAMVAKGIADPARIGLYGWSHGAFIVEFLLAHSQKHFKAAALGEGGDYNPGEYWISGMTHWPQIFQNMYGGPLSPKTAASYFEFAPVFQAERFDAPLLMEYSGREGFFGFEMYIPLRVLGKPVELVTYDDEPHIFVSPRARLASMARKIDWFNYWMLDTEDPGTLKQEQYSRWHQLRADWEMSAEHR
ncbi:MAG: prolyl oligopeptidase family serine peptidase [Gammaproteobacteria bacterium]